MPLGPKVTLQDVTAKDSGPQHLRLVGRSGTESAVPRRVERYTLCEEIAFGGMGAVHLGVLQGAAGFCRPVAIKRLHSHLGQHAANDELRQEAWLASQVRHPNVVPVLDLVEADRKLFLVMEFVLGQTLARLNRKNHLMPVPITIAILCDALQGLHAAHTATGLSGRALHIVHRDVSPQNILVGADGVARLLDFGVAKCLAAEGRFCETTELGFFKGKLGYIAPEQLLSDPLDARTDIFAAGIVLWEALTGRRPFKGSDPTQALLRLANQGIPAPSTYNRDVTPSLDAVVARAVHRNPQSRFQSAEEFAEHLQSATARAPAGRVARYVEKAAAIALDEQRLLLRRIQAPEGISVARKPVPPESSAPEGTTSSFVTQRLLALLRANPSYLSKLAAAVGVGALVLAGAVYALSARAPRREPPEPSALQTPPVAEKRALPSARSMLTSVDSARASGVGKPVDATAISPLPPAEAPLVEAPPAQARLVEAPPAQARLVEAPPAQAPVVEAPPAQAPVVEAPPAQAPVVEAPPAQAPVVEAPPAQAPPTRAPSARGKAKLPVKEKAAPKRRAISRPPSCHPPYRVDDGGIKRIKRECL